MSALPSLRALHAMEKIGGSFVQALANCYYMADSENKQKLADAFSAYFDAYEQKAQLMGITA